MKISKQTQMIAGVAVLAVVAVMLYKKNKEKKALTAPVVGGAAPAMTDASSAGFVKEGLWSVGAYDPATNETYVFPEGNMGGGKRIKGRLNVPQGTAYRPSAY